MWQRYSMWSVLSDSSVGIRALAYEHRVHDDSERNQHEHGPVLSGSERLPRNPRRIACSAGLRAKL